MKARQVCFVIIVLGGLSLALLGCGAPPASPAAAPWTLTVVNGEAERSFSLVDLKGLPATEIRYTAKETGQENTYQGVRLRELLAVAGADLEDLGAVEIEAEDGFTAIYPREVALRDTSVLVYGMGGGPLPDSMGRVRMLSPGEGTSLQVKFVIRITVSPGG